jgi:ABC-type uncharacterized transport system auxiliary subunit
LSPLILIIFLSGCSIFPSPSQIDINYYDIGFPEKKINTDVPFNVLPLTGGVGTEPRMIFRRETNQIAFDAYNRWSFSPAKLIQRYISLSFDDGKISEVKHFISGDVLRFDGDLVNKTANISIKLDINSYDHNKLISSEIYSVSVPVKGENATAYAKGMEEGMSQIIEKIAIQIKQSKGK